MREGLLTLPRLKLELRTDHSRLALVGVEAQLDTDCLRQGGRVDRFASAGDELDCLHVRSGGGDVFVAVLVADRFQGGPGADLLAQRPGG